MTRISTFFAVVTPNKNYDIYLTSTPPNKLRFRLLNSDSSIKVRLSMYYFTSMRIDLYLNGTYVAPTNAYYINNNLVLKNVSNNTAPYMPTYSNKSGVNLFFNKQMYFSMSGADVIDLRIAPVLFVSFGLPPMTPDQFFEPATLVQNFANLLGIDPSKIRMVNIVRATSSSSFNNRRRRDTSNQITMSLTIYEDPIQMLNDTASMTLISNQQAQLGATIVNKFATGQLQEEAAILFNGTTSLMSMSVRQPLASPNSSEVVIGKIHKLVVIQAASSCNAQVPCLVQPILRVVDEYVKKYIYKFILLYNCYILLKISILCDFFIKKVHLEFLYKIHFLIKKFKRFKRTFKCIEKAYLKSVFTLIFLSLIMKSDWYNLNFG